MSPHERNFFFYQIKTKLCHFISHLYFHFSESETWYLVGIIFHGFLLLNYSDGLFRRTIACPTLSC